MGQLRTALRAYASEGHPPSTVMARASAFLTELDTERLATCLYATVSPRTGQTLIARAGHPDPFLRHADGHVTALDTHGGLPLGLPGPPPRPTPPPASSSSSDDTLLLCTDGLLESGRRSIDTGTHRVLNALAHGTSANSAHSPSTSSTPPPTAVPRRRRGPPPRHPRPPPDRHQDDNSHDER